MEKTALEMFLEECRNKREEASILLANREQHLREPTFIYNEADELIYFAPPVIKDDE